MEKTGHEILTRQNNAYEQHQPLISVHLMTMDDANPELSRLGMYERRLNDAASIASVFNLEVVSNCGGKFSEATMDKVQRIIDQFSFPIVMTFCDGIVKGRNLTLSNAVGPLSFFWDDDCVLLPDALSVFQVMMEKLKTSDFCAAGVRSVDLDYKHYKPRPGLKPCLAYPELRRLADDEVIDYIGDVIPAGIHGMAFLMYTKPLREVGGFASFLRNQGEWGAVWTELWRQKGLSCVYVLRPEVKILHDHAPFSPNRTMSGRFAESCIYMIFYAYIYGIEPQDPLYKIGQERYLRAVAKTYKMNDLGWLDLFWKRLTELCAEQRNLVDEELSRRLITGLAIQNEFMTEIGAACRYARQNIGVLKGIRDNSQANAKFLSIKPFGEFENANVIREIITAASVSIAPYKL